MTDEHDRGLDRSTSTSQKDNLGTSRDEEGKRSASHPGVPAMTDGPAGNAIYDPAEQTTREDMPRAEQPSEGEVHRGSLPPRGSRAGDAPRAGQTPQDQEEQAESSGA